MNEIKIGTLLPGKLAIESADAIINLGFETISPSFHMTLGDIDLSEYAKKLMDKIDGRVPVSAFGLYCNPIQNEESIEDLKKCIDNAHLFGTNIVSTFAGAYTGQSVDVAIPKFKEVFTYLTKHAEDKGVSIALENCTMHGTWAQTTHNIAFNAKALEMIFNEVQADNLGLEWEPAHQMGQLIDPINNLKHWVDKIIHVHGKDATVDYDFIRDYGVYGSESPVKMRTPGFGDTNWRDIFYILLENSYKGNLCIEGYHDPIYRDEYEMTGQVHALNYLKWARGGDFNPNPW